MHGVLAQVSLDQGLQEAWNDLVSVIPKLFVLGVILLAGFAIASLASVGVVRLLRRMGFDRAVERGGIGRALARSRFDATDLLGRLVMYGLLLVTLQLAFAIFGDNPVSGLLTSLMAYLPKVFVAMVMVVVAASVAAAVRDIVTSSLSALSYGNALGTAAAGTIVAIGVFAALDQLEIAPAIVLGLFYALLAVIAGSAIVAIGGGGIQPMRARWERALTRIEDEAPRMREGARETMAQRRVDLVAEEERARWDAEHAQRAAQAEQTTQSEHAYTTTGPGDTTQELPERPRPPMPPTPTAGS